MADSDSDDLEKPPERRAPSGRAGRGNRMGRLIAEEEDEKEEEADKSFYQQEFWADEEADNDFAADADDEEARDSFDSDFGDSTESDDDDDDDEDKPKKRAPAAKKKGVYKDPKLAHKKGEGPGSSAAAGGAAAPMKPSHKKRPRPEVDALPSERTRRTSTQDASEATKASRARIEAAAKERAEKARAAGAKRGVELVRLTQAEILAEAAQTEIINRASLERMLRMAEEKRREVVRERKTDGPRIKFHSKRNGDSVTNTVTFCETPVPAAIDGIAPPYPAPQRCAVTSAPAKYIDPHTGCAYATLEAFRTLRGRTGRRQHSFSGAPATPAGGAADE